MKDDSEPANECSYYEIPSGEEERKARRCRKPATKILFNGDRPQGKVCDACAVKVLQKFTFLRSEAIQRMAQ